MELNMVIVDKPEAVNFIFGQSHFIKTVDDIHEALVATVPGIKFGVAFCEASGPALVRVSGTDAEMMALAQKNALSVSAGHSFFIFLAEGFYPINILNTIKMVPEVCHIFCATANPVEIIILDTAQGRAVLGVVDGVKPQGVENEDDRQKRKDFLKAIGYKV